MTSCGASVREIDARRVMPSKTPGPGSAIFSEIPKAGSKAAPE